MPHTLFGFRLRLDPYLAVLLGLCALAAAPLTAPGYFMFAHDARHTVYFMQMFDAALREGALYPRWATDMTFGYGYPVWIILAPLPYYLAESFHLVGLDFPAAVKAIEGLGLIASGLAMYLFARRVLGREGGLLAAVAYLYIPYHIVDLYVRGAYAEFLAFIFPPLIFWALYEIFATTRRVFILLLAAAYGGLILTHMQTAVVFSPIIGLYILLLFVAHTRQSARLHPSVPSSVVLLLYSALGILWGLALSAAFLLPVLAEQRYLTTEPLIGGFFDFRQHFVSPAQLLSPFWGYGYAGINGGDQFSLQLGVAPLFLAALALPVLARQRGMVRANLVFFGLISLAIILLILSLSAPLWELAAPVVAFVQFPWRLLGVAAFTLAFIAGAAVLLVRRHEAIYAALLFSLFLVLAMFPNARPQYTETTFTYNTLMDFEVKDRELLGDTIWMEPGKRPQDSPLVEQYRGGAITQKAILAEGTGRVELLAHRFLGDDVRVTADGPVRVLFYTRYFPGWTAVLDGQAVKVEPYGEQGLLSVLAPPGPHVIRTQFGETPDRLIGAALSLFAGLTMAGWLWRTRPSRLQLPQAVLE